MCVCCTRVCVRGLGQRGQQWESVGLGGCKQRNFKGAENLKACASVSRVQQQIETKWVSRARSLRLLAARLENLSQTIVRRALSKKSRSPEPPALDLARAALILEFRMASSCFSFLHRSCRLRSLSLQGSSSQPTAPQIKWHTQPLMLLRMRFSLDSSILFAIM